MSRRERTAMEYRISELSTGAHLVAFLRPRLQELGCVPLCTVRDHRDASLLRVAGLVITRQAPASASGFRFFTLADEGATLDLVFRPDVARRTRAVADYHPLLMVDGVLQSEGGRLNIIVHRVQALDADGHPIAHGAAVMGARAGGDAPRPQHGFTRPPRGGPQDGRTTAEWAFPESHDFR